MKFVLDASVALSWLLEDAGPGQEYAVAVFDTLTRVDAEAHVSVTWGLELANVIAKCQMRGPRQSARGAQPGFSCRHPRGTDHPGSGHVWQDLARDDRSRSPLSVVRL